MQQIDKMEEINVRADLKEAALQFIKEDVEKKYNVKVLICVETGSRGYHTHTEQSDMDVKGFYVSKTDDYLTVGDKKKILQKTHHFLTLNDGSQVEFDFTFLDIRKFLKRKLRCGKIDQMNLWAMSECVYLNELDEDTMHFFQKELKKPYFALNGHMKTYLKIFSKEKPTLKVKEILTSIIVGAQLLHMIIFGENPIYQTWKQQNHLIKYAYSLKQQNKDIPIPLRNMEAIKSYALELYELKKDARKGEIDVINPVCIDWMRQVIEFYKEFSDKTLSPDYSDTPEITDSRANEILQRMRKLLD